jgi:hypothetical protein
MFEEPLKYDCVLREPVVTDHEAQGNFLYRRQHRAGLEVVEGLLILKFKLRALQFLASGATGAPQAVIPVIPKTVTNGVPAATHATAAIRGNMS